MFLSNLRRRELPLATTNVVVDGNALAVTKYCRRNQIAMGQTQLLLTAILSLQITLAATFKASTTTLSCR
jgi:hypothetical protein